jgi:hypothetical protein
MESGEVEINMEIENREFDLELRKKKFVKILYLS